MTSASPTTKIVDFVQRESGTTLFAPRNMMILALMSVLLTVH